MSIHRHTNKSMSQDDTFYKQKRSNDLSGILIYYLSVFYVYKQHRINSIPSRFSNFFRFIFFLYVCNKLSFLKRHLPNHLNY